MEQGGYSPGNQGIWGGGRLRGGEGNFMKNCLHQGKMELIFLENVDIAHCISNGLPMFLFAIVLTNRASRDKSGKSQGILISCVSGNLGIIIHYQVNLCYTKLFMH